MITVTSVDAQNKFGQLLDAAQREPITITRHGRPVAMLMAVEEFEARTQPGAAARAARRAIAAFRGAGKGGTVEQLFADRRADKVREPAPAYPTKTAGTKKGRR
jgi:prevent-host-death family protein